jgi:predicted N-formylglutamate amidohydrolase
VLDSHRGFDPGALAVARALSRALDAPLIAATVSRLVIDLNRSWGNPRRWSAYSRRLDGVERERIEREFYTPHRRRVEGAIARSVSRGIPVIHVAVHSFTPRLAGVTRKGDVGLLYDPARPRERAFCARWLALFLEADPRLGVRRNVPYRGNADGLTTALRRRFAEEAYLGIELELNQKLVARSGRARSRLAGAVARTLLSILAPPTRRARSASS